MEVVKGPEFLDLAKPLVEDVLRKHGKLLTAKVLGEGAQRHYQYEFELFGQPHTIDLATDSPWMYRGNKQYECYMKSEWQSMDVLAASFARRLDRYLSGGSWEGDDESHPFGRWIRKFFA